ncbi:hypothetical protein PCANC_24142 [Puccinia coronata f. sp. avenae]|uniref:Uncharacterized protein n=1 Tax=Puccinia coronata f. sp. avenae TaxID=200324 RepID=A0A2N5TQ90_9BASI|nr:hypothetical protein PCANC_24142 [Puccinia coronata f. sp. avenae]
MKPSSLAIHHTSLDRGGLVHRWPYSTPPPHRLNSGLTVGSQDRRNKPGSTVGTIKTMVQQVPNGAKPPRLDHRLFHRQPHHHIPTFTQPTGTALGERWAGATTMSTPPIRMEDKLSVLSEQIPTPTPPPQLTKVELTCSLWFENPFTSPPAGSPLSLAKNFIRQTLTNSRVETYNLEHVPADSKVIDLSLRWVATLPKTDQKNFLPPGYQSKNPNPKAVQMVDRIIRDYVKKDKGILRGCLMKNVVTNSIYREIGGAIPKIEQLIAHVKKHLPHHVPFSQQNSKIPTQVLVRFAFMRLATIAYHQGGQNKRAAQWGPIDRQLLLIQSKGMDYYLAWSELILEKDQVLFGTGRMTYNQLPFDLELMPTEEEIAAHIIVSKERRGEEEQDSELHPEQH